MLTQGTSPGNVAVAARWSPGLTLVTSLQVELLAARPVASQPPGRQCSLAPRTGYAACQGTPGRSPAMLTATCPVATTLPEAAPHACAWAKCTLRPRRVHRPVASRSSPEATDRYCTDREIVVRRLPLGKSGRPSPRLSRWCRAAPRPPRRGDTRVRADTSA